MRCTICREDYPAQALSENQRCPICLHHSAKKAAQTRQDRKISFGIAVAQGRKAMRQYAKHNNPMAQALLDAVGCKAKFVPDGGFILKTIQSPPERHYVCDTIFRHLRGENESPRQFLGLFCLYDPDKYGRVMGYLQTDATVNL